MLLGPILSAVCCAQLVAVACLYLGCKVQESPKYLRDVIRCAETRKWARWCDEHPAERKKWEDMVRVDATLLSAGLQHLSW